MPRLVSVRNLMSCRRPTKRSRSRKTENSSRQSESLRILSFFSSSLIKMPLPHIVSYIDRNGTGVGRHHHVHARLYRLIPEYEQVCRLFAALPDFIGFHVTQRLTGTDCGAHGLLPNRRAVVTHIALHHLFVFRDDLGYAKRTRQHTIGTANATRLKCGANDAVFPHLDGIGWANHGACRLLAMPAHISGGPGHLMPVKIVEVDHRHAAMRFAFLASCQTRL